MKKVMTLTQEMLRKALILAGDIPPVTEDDVALVEKNLRVSTDLPENLRDPHTLLEKAKQREANGQKVRLPNAVDFVMQDLARAARNGGEITTDIEERMREARKRALDEDGTGGSNK
jgi:hypothetical protein